MAASLLADGQIVGWFQGRTEFGPRALGNRSLLADPRGARVREELNRRIKHREPFRPFGASVLAEEAGRWFAISGDRDGAASCRSFMILAYPVRPDRAPLIPAVVHAGWNLPGSVRRRAAEPAVPFADRSLSKAHRRSARSQHVVQ